MTSVLIVVVVGSITELSFWGLSSFEEMPSNNLADSSADADTFAKEGMLVLEDNNQQPCWREKTMISKKVIPNNNQRRDPGSQST